MRVAVLAPWRDGRGVIDERVGRENSHAVDDGAVTFVNEAQGYLRIGGAFGVDRDGTLVRINGSLFTDSFTGRRAGPDQVWLYAVESDAMPCHQRHLG